MHSTSIFISSSGRIPLLLACLESICNQKHGPQSIVIGANLAYVDAISELINKIKKPHQPPNTIQIIETESKLPHTGRNWALKNLPGRILLFIDEDVELPHSQFLENVEAFHKALPDEILGGFYLNSPHCTQSGKAYNEIANLWLQRHRTPQPHLNAQDLVVAGNFSLKLTPKTRLIKFSKDRSFGGEEFEFIRRHHLSGHKSRLIKELSVFHHAQHDLKTFFRRAWLHGKQNSNDKKLKLTDIALSLTLSGGIRERALIYSYLACTRAARLKLFSPTP